VGLERHLFLRYFCSIIKLAGFKLLNEEPELCAQICDNLVYWRDEKQLLDGWLRVNVEIELEKRDVGFDDVLRLEAIALETAGLRDAQHDLLFNQYILPLANSKQPH